MNYLMKYKGKYRILPVLDELYHDLPRDANGNISHEDVELYIACQYGNKITEYGTENGRMTLKAYIPSVLRGRNIRKALDTQGVPYTRYRETDEEAEFCFKAKDIEPVATLLKAKTLGANISPFSTKNLPKADIKIPTEEIERYKAITSEVQKEDLLIIYRITNDFLTNVLEKHLKKLHGKRFNITVDMRKLMMGRMTKEYIWFKGMWDEYLEYLGKNIKKFYEGKK